MGGDAEHEEVRVEADEDEMARRRDEATSTMAKGVFGWAARESARRAGGATPPPAP